MVGRNRGAASSTDGGDDQPRSGTDGRSSARRRKPQRDVLIGLAGACELVVASLVTTLRPRGPYPILVVNGEQGSGKSVFCCMLRSLVDPSAAPIRAVPKDDRDLIVSAVNSWVLAFDNLSTIPGWLSDALCRLATGGGFATRMLHTDHEEMIFEGQRPVLLNGIPLLTDRADLADRAVTIHFRAIPDHERPG